jgi:sec-independent protein translocase protein TatA
MQRSVAQRTPGVGANPIQCVNFASGVADGIGSVSNQGLHDGSGGKSSQRTDSYKWHIPIVHLVLGSFFRFARWTLVFGLFADRRGQNGAGWLDRTNALPRYRADVVLLIKTLSDCAFRLALHGTLRLQGGPMLRQIGPMELLVILLVALLLFGGKKIPELAKGLGEGIRNFKDSLKPPDEPPTQRPDEKKQA